MKKFLTTTFIAVLTAVSVCSANPVTVSAHGSHCSHHTTSTCSKKKKCKHYKDRNHNKKCDYCGKKKSAHHK